MMKCHAQDRQVELQKWKYKSLGKKTEVRKSKNQPSPYGDSLRKRAGQEEAAWYRALWGDA